MKPRPHALVLCLAALLLLLVLCSRHRSPALPAAPAPARSNNAETLAHLGRRLFFDTRLSFNNTKSCASCHNPGLAFSDGYRRSVTATGDNVPHNAPSLIGAADLAVLDWADPSVTTLEAQSRTPLFGRHPVELGLDDEGLERLRKDTLYRQLFGKAFPDAGEPVTAAAVQAALAAFVATLRADAAPYDRFVHGDRSALSKSAQQGLALFTSSKTHCAHCHRPPAFTLNQRALRLPPDSFFYNTGLYRNYPAGDEGLYRYTRRPADAGKFAVPSLRNAALTAPYMHDGSVATLSEVIDHYAAGGRKLAYGPAPGDGRRSANKSALVAGFRLTADEKQALIDFLYSLTDTTLALHPGWQPYAAQAP